MRFLFDIVIPLLCAGLAIGIISYIINVVLRAIKFDVSIVKIALFFVAWYFVGPIIYDFLLNYLIEYENEIITFIYQPIQIIMELLEI